MNERDLTKGIAERAYEIWESEGRPQGRSDQHWEQARAEFAEAKAEADSAAASPPAVKGRSAAPKAAARGAAKKTRTATPPGKTGER